MRAGSRQHGLDTGHLAEIDECRVEIAAVSQAGVFVGPVLQHYIHIAVRCDEAVRPEWDAAFVESAIDLICRRFENCRAGDHHLKLSVDPAQTR